MTTAENSKRIAKNTLMLYVRMAFIMAVTLYTSRVVLDVLGVEDYGIYNVVGGVVAMLTFLNSSLNTATQRYMNVEMGRGNADGLRKVFAMSFICFCLLAVVALLLAESVGLWFMRHKLVIPPERMEAATWVFHFSVLTFLTNLITVPYQASIIAHERMSVYAYLSVAEAAIRLLAALALQWVETDKLWLYGLLMFLTTLLVSTAYRTYCARLFAECKVRWLWDRKLLKGLFSFSGWMLAGTFSVMLNGQGVNILINLFFGPALNAARAVAMQVYTAVNTFAVNFMTAVRPQIVKSYAQGDESYMYQLVFSASKGAFFLLFMLSLPVVLNMEWLLGLWLTNVPDSTVLFARLVLIDLLVQVLFNPLSYVVQASGRIRNFQLMISLCFLAIPILSWCAFRMGAPAYATFVIAIVVDVISLFGRMWVLRNTVTFSIRRYLHQVGRPILTVWIVATGLAIAGQLLPTALSTTPKALTSIVWSVSVAAVTIWLLGLNHSEKSLIRQGIHKIIKTKHQNT